MFHSRDGLYFKKNDNSITVLIAPQVKVIDPIKGTFYEPARVIHEVTLTIEEFASIMATMSKRGETGNTWKEAVDFLVKDLQEEKHSKDILPCPFCGSDNIKFFGTNGDCAYCRNCNAEGPSSLLKTIPDAIKEWNRRSNAI